MSKQIILQRKVAVQCWHVPGQVSKAQKRLEIMPVLLRAKEMDGTDANDIANSLFFEAKARKVAAGRLLQMAQNLGLLKQDKNRLVLTESGETAIQTEEIFVPEEGTWKLWVSEDPLLNTAILQVGAWREPNAFDEVMGKDKNAAKKRKMEELPRWLHETTGVSIKPAASVDGRQMRIDELQNKGESVNHDASLKLVWNVSAATLQLVGEVSGRAVKTALTAPQVSEADVWQQLLEGEELWQQWDAHYQALRIDFESAEPSVREVMACDLDFEQPQIRDFGRFEKCTVTGIALRAATAADAQLWAHWRLQQRIRDYATSARFAQWQQEAAQPFIDEFQLRLPSRRELVNQAWPARGARPVPGVWHLVAAQDWGM